MKDIDIELFGIPGSGKTTYCEKNFKDLCNLNLRLYSNSRAIRNIKRILFAFLYTINNKKKYKSICDFFERTQFFKPKTKIKLKLLLLSVLYLKVQNVDKRILFEEGIIQSLWAICYNSNYSEDTIDEYLLLLNEYLPDTLYILDIDPEIVASRLLARNNRGGSELQHDIRKTKQSLDRAYEIEKRIIAALSKTKITLEYL